MIVINFSLQHSHYKRENFEILKNSLYRELWWRRDFVKYLCSISFELHDIDIDAHGYYKWAKKEEENSTIKFLFLSFDDYERSLSSLSEACNGIKFMVRWIYMQLFPLLQTNRGWGTLLVFVKIVLQHLPSLKQHVMVGEWLICCKSGIPQYNQVLKSKLLKTRPLLFLT